MAFPVNDLTVSEFERYSRHLTLPEVGLQGQRRLKAARVLCIGAGGLGSPAALYLAAAGIGTLGLADFDVVDLSNLHRQIIHGTGDVGRSKLQSARDICSAFGVPPMLVGVQGDATYANFKEARLALWEDTILPLVDNMVDGLNTRLVPKFGDGLRCIQATGIRRFKVKTVVGNTATYPQLGDNSISVAGLVGSAGLRHYQGWYRSASPTFCTAATFNLTNGITITWVP